MVWIDLLYIGLLVIGLVLVHFAIKKFRNTKKLLQNGTKYKAEVIRLINTGSDGNSYLPVFEVLDKSQNVIRFNGDISSNPPMYKMGERVDVIYSKYSKKGKVIGYWGLFRWTIILLCIASPMLIISLGYWLYNYVSLT